MAGKSSRTRLCLLTVITAVLLVVLLRELSAPGRALGSGGAVALAGSPLRTQRLATAMPEANETEQLGGLPPVGPDLTGWGSLSRPCGSTISPYVQRRMKELWDRAVAGDDWARICHTCLSPDGDADPGSCSSQYGQDVFYYHMTAKCLDRPGTYVDIGAHEPMKLSNTWMLDVCLGWRGLCIEASPHLAGLFHGTRTCKVIDRAIGLREGPMKMTHSGADGEVVSDATNSGKEGGMDVVMTTLDKVLMQQGYLPSDGSADSVTIDLLSLDVEQFELPVLLSFPWDKMDLRLAMIENNDLTLDVEELMNDKGFAKVLGFGPDDIYARLPSGMPLQRSHKMEYLRKSHAILRKQQHGRESYHHKALYNGWSHVLNHVKATGEIPKE